MNATNTSKPVLSRNSSNVDLVQDSEKEFDISVYLRILNRSKLIICLVTIVCLFVGIYIAQTTQPIYNATAKILADPYQPNADREEQYIASAMVFLFFETQYEIIRSRAITAKVVERLGLVEKARREQQKNQPATSWIKTLKDEVKTLIGYESDASGPLSDDDLKIIIANTISEKIIVSGGRKNQIITINYQSKDPKEAADIINALADVYIEFGLSTRLTDVQNQQKWLTTQYQQLQKNLEESESRVKEYQDQQGLINSYQQRAMANTQLQSLNTNLVAAQTELSVKSEEYALIQGIKNGTRNFSSLAQIMQDETIVQLLQDETNKRSKVNELDERYGKLHPKMITARTELKNATENLANETSKIIVRIESQYNLAKLQVTNINTLINKTKDNVRAIQDESTSLVSLEREVENNRRIYEAFQSRLLEANVKGEISASNVHIIDKATVPRIAISPNVKKIIMLAGVFGIFLGVALAFLREIANNTFRTPDLVEEKLKLAVLGITPCIKGQKDIVAPEKQYLHDNRSTFAESINTIRTGIMFSNIDHPPKSILITSATGAEGKSTLAINLAVAFSNIGKTLLLEVDLRKPSMNKNLDFGKTLGLSDILSGEVKVSSDVIKTINNGQLSIITSGSIPQNPMELLSSNKFEKLLASLSEHYEHIILDGPPTLPVSDSCVIANKVDGVIITVRADQTKIKVAKEAASRLQKLNANIVGTVLTVAELKKMSYYGDHYYSGEYYGVKPASTNK
jgi:capsular exopolysaccharide synthesis family protein